MLKMAVGTCIRIRMWTTRTLSTLPRTRSSGATQMDTEFLRQESVGPFAKCLTCGPTAQPWKHCSASSGTLTSTSAISPERLSPTLASPTSVAGSHQRSSSSHKDFLCDLLAMPKHAASMWQGVGTELLWSTRLGTVCAFLVQVSVFWPWQRSASRR